MIDRFWEDPEVVARFAARDVDHRVRAFVESHPKPSSLRALDIGCAGGRNTVYLASHGVDVYAIDGSAAMVAESLRRLEPILGRDEARARVRQRTMDDLSKFADASFDLVIALGIFHEAGSMREWHQAVAEAARVLAPTGRLLLAHFAPGTLMEDAPPIELAEEPGVFQTATGRRRVLLDAHMIDANLADHGLEPLSPTETVAVQLEDGRSRITVNGEYGLRR